MLYCANILYEATEINPMLNPEVYLQFYVEKGADYLTEGDEESDDI